MDDVIQADRVSRTFGHIRALSDFSISVPRGVIYGVLGPSGSGKTTLIRMVAGALAPTAGTLTVLGRRMPDRGIASKIGYMTQSAALYPDLSLRENLEFFGAIYGLSGHRLSNRIEEIVYEVELENWLDTPIRTFSGGMLQRSSLTCALLHQPELLLLDEPTVGLDPVLRQTLWTRFRTMADAGTTLLVSSHIMDEAERCDILGFIREGELLVSDSPEQIRSRTGQPTLEQAFLRLADNTATAVHSL